jgi:hypothetical protein
VARAETAVADLAGQVARAEASLAAKTAERQALVPLVERQIAALRTFIQGSLPFRTTERLRQCDVLQADLAAGQMGADQVLARVWAAMEDEFRLARENGLYTEPITVDGVEHLAAIVRLGTVALYFRLADGRVGVVAPEGTGWAHRLVTEPSASAQLTTLFEAFQKRIRQGYFPVPNPYAR